MYLPDVPRIGVSLTSKKPVALFQFLRPAASQKKTLLKLMQIPLSSR